MKYKLTTEDIKQIRKIRDKMASQSHYNVHRYLQQVQSEANALLSRSGIRLRIENPLPKRRAA